MIKLAITGAAGRMGQRIATLAKEADDYEIAAAIEGPGHEALGRDVGEVAGIGACGVAISEAIPDDVQPDVMIDFSLPEGTAAWVEVCRERKIPDVIGTTGLSEPQQKAVEAAAAETPIVFAGNFSMGINLLCRLVELAAEKLGDAYDIEIVEAHHRFKKDAPSGTAIMLANSACRGGGRKYEEAAVHGRSGHQPRQPGEIGIHAVRVGDTVGEHAVHFGNLGETVTLSHAAHTRDTFVRGALRAGRWLQGKDAGLYDMMDVLGL